jgi:cyclopropane-fatty-acyl-phospholipid synthase
VRSRPGGPILGARVIDAVVDLGCCPTPLLRAGSGCCCVPPGGDHPGAWRPATSASGPLIASSCASPVAIHTDQANEQHYEVPTELFELMLGPHLKYSRLVGIGVDGARSTRRPPCCGSPAERAELADGQDVLELGCGWGSLTLWMAEHFPSSRITAVSNSATQREHIEKRAGALGQLDQRHGPDL